MKMLCMLAICMTAVQSILAGGTIGLSNFPQDVGGTNGRFFDNKQVFLSGTNYLAQLYAGKEEGILVAVGSPESFFMLGRFADPAGAAIPNIGEAWSPLRPCAPA